MFSRQQISNVIYGVAVGDALGAPFEFMSPEEIVGPIEMRGGQGVLCELAPGEWTDDTEMTLRLAENISLPLDLQKITLSYIEWADSDPKDIGITTKAALSGSTGYGDSRQRARLFHEETGRSAGNGTIMRAAPLAFLPLADYDLLPVVLEEARITHWALEAAEASWAQALLIRKLLRGEDPLLEKGTLQPKTQEALARSDNQEWVAKEVAKGGSAWSSLAAALWSLQFDSFREGLEAVIALGYDTDTNAACAGALLAAKFGEVPKELCEPLEDQPRIDRAIDNLCKL